MLLPNSTYEVSMGFAVDTLEKGRCLHLTGTVELKSEGVNTADVDVT